jgi:O-antigen ligase
LVVPLLFMMIVGVVGLLRGLKAGIDFNDAFGDFRRGYFYLLAILIPLLIGQYRRTAKMVDATMRAAALVLITAGLLQLALGKLDRRMVLDAAHILSHFLLVVVSYLFFRELPFLFLPGYSSNRRLLALAQCFAASMVVILGNFRSVWLAFFGACLIMFFVVAGKMKAYFIGLAILGTTLLVLGIGLLWTYPIGDRGKTLGDEISLKLKHTKEMDRDLNIIWRKQSYTAALESWAAQPILGTGLGKMNDFFVLKSDGNIRLASRNRPHNGYLWFLQTVGITGLLVVLWFHSTIFFRLAGRVRQSSQGKIEFIPLYWGAFGFYCCFMIASGFDVLLEMATRILTISIVMGAALLPLALRDDPATQTDQSKTSFD